MSGFEIAGMIFYFSISCLMCICRVGKWGVDNQSVNYLELLFVFVFGPMNFAFKAIFAGS